MRKAGVILTLALSLLAYSPYGKIKARLYSLAKANPSLVKIIPAGADLVIVRISGRGTIPPEKRPAIFVAGNIGGDYPLATEAALHLVEKLVKEKPEVLKKVTFYILPLGNPQAYGKFFQKPLREFHKNLTPWDDDRDGLTDEDPPEDLNGDGFITTMLVPDPMGKYIHDPKDPRIVRKADPLKGERGKFKLMTEGIDNDGDGKINEDDIGGINIEKNFPHGWKPHTDDGGLWPASEPQTRAILDFLFSHRNISLVFSFSQFNNLLKLPPRKTAKPVEEMKVKVPKGIAAFLGFEAGKKYTIKEIVEAVKKTSFGRSMEITPEMVASFFGLGPAVNINRKDMKFYEKISELYKEHIKKYKLNPSRPVKSPTDGSFEEWVYFQYGVPCFTSDIWSVPKRSKGKKQGWIEKLAKMTPEEFLKLPDEKIAEMLKQMGAPSMMSPQMLKNMVKSGRITPAKMAEMAKKAKSQEAEGRKADLLAWVDKNLNGKGFLPWKKFHHPTLGDVEIGGFLPYITSAPPLKLVKRNIEADTDFIIKLAEKLPRLEITEVKVEPLGKNVFRITLWVSNAGLFPTAMAHGITNRQVPPVFAEIQGAEVLYGKRRQRASAIGPLEAKKFQWVVFGKRGRKITLKVFHVKSGQHTVEAVLK